MAYEPTTWQDGDVITAEKMNKIESGLVNGSGGGCIYLTTDIDYGVYLYIYGTETKVKMQDIYGWLDDGKIIYLTVDWNDGLADNQGFLGISKITSHDGGGPYTVQFYSENTGGIQFNADTLSSNLSKDGGGPM